MFKVHAYIHCYTYLPFFRAVIHSLDVIPVPLELALEPEGMYN